MSEHCGVCGRFVAEHNAGRIYDDYAGGWEVDPRCPEHGGITREKYEAALGSHEQEEPA